MGFLKESGTSSGSERSYEIRRYEPSDRGGVLELDDIVWGRRRSPAWFAWKYERNPFLSEVPVFVAEFDGEVVGARPLLAFRLRTAGTEFLALQPSDTMVHPDHRGRGLFTRMTESAIETYADREPTLFFNFPNSQARPGYHKLGWRDAGVRRTYYRVQNAEPLLSSTVGDRLGHALGRALSPALEGHNRVHDLYARPVADLSVHRRNGVPEELLASLYQRRVPDRIHARRDDQFYRWRFDSPAWSRLTYVAVGDGEPVAAAITRSRVDADGATLTQVAEVVPLEGGERWLAAVANLFDRIIDDHRGSDLLAVAGAPLPYPFLRRFGFLSDDRFPLSRLKATDRTIAVRPLDCDGPEAWRVNGRSLTDGSNWLVTFAERDTT